MVEEMPLYPGGVEAMMKFISSNIKYPSVCMEQNIGGKVFLKFIVDEAGAITTVEVIRSSGAAIMDEEAMRVVKLMPAWAPGKQNGKAVKTYFNLPINFKLNTGKPMVILKRATVGEVYQKGCDLLLNGNSDGAIELLSTVPDDTNAQFVLGVLLYNKGKKADAKVCLQKAKEGITDSSDAYYGLVNDYLTKYFGQK